MVPITSLLIPIVLSAVIVFLASFVVHMLLPLHRSDLRQLPEEDRLQDALRPFNIPPGNYALPCAGSPAGMRKPEFLAKMTKGPVMLLTVMRPGPPAMGAQLAIWFLYSIVVGILAAYVTGRALGFGANYLQVFRFAGCTAFIGYSVALIQDSIWYRRAWSTTIKYMIDGLLYGLLTAGTFGWLWPR